MRNHRRSAARLRVHLATRYAGRQRVPAHPREAAGVACGAHHRAAGPIPARETTQDLAEVTCGGCRASQVYKAASTTEATDV